MTKPWPKPVFVGAAPRRSPDHAELIFSYMTAEQMQAKVTSLTGYEHPAFEEFAAILGHVDPTTSMRTSDRPTLLSVLVLQHISADLADAIIAREAFIDPQERIVFVEIDLSSILIGLQLEEFLRRLFMSWLGQALEGKALQDFLEVHAAAVKQTGGLVPTAGYRAVLALLLQHGGLYYT